MAGCGKCLYRRDVGDYQELKSEQNYLPDDLKGKGEPSYSLDKALKDHDRASRHLRANGQAFELAERPRAVSEPQKNINDSQRYSDWEEERRRVQSSSHRYKVSDGLKRRAGSPRKKDRRAQ